MDIFNQRFLDCLMEELRTSMRGLLIELCRDFERRYRGETARLGLPVGWFRMLARTLPHFDYSHWKVVGWIETLNDLLYFVDVLVQVRRARSSQDIAEQLQEEFQDLFYENSYAEEVFPAGKPERRLLAGRLDRLCRRLAREVVEESVWLAPEAACRWASLLGLRDWRIPCQFAADLEQVELPDASPVGTQGVWYEVPRTLRGRVRHARELPHILIRPTGIHLALGPDVLPIVEYGPDPKWHWIRHEAIGLHRSRYGELVLGPTLVYNRNRIPVTVRPTEPAIGERIKKALRVIEEAWPEGNELLSLLTSRIAPLRATGVVSFSYRHRPGLSVINCFDRDNLDLIDDLIHENSHHHLNLLLRKYVMYGGDHNQEIFYSPWRRSLRPIRGILHATFTFTMGALLFERLSSWAETRKGKAHWRAAGLTPRDLRRARARCVEEIESVRYSLQDLAYAAGHLKWLTASGRQLVGQLATAIERAERRIAPHRRAVLKSEFGPALRTHVNELQQARQTYGPMRLARI